MHKKGSHCYRVIVYPGTFNPITKAHLAIAQKAAVTLQANELIFLPTGNNYKKEEKIDGVFRYLMILENLPQMNKNVSVSDCYFSVDDYEIVNEGCCTYQSMCHILEHLSAMKMDKEVLFIVGDDNIEDVPNWKHADKLLSQFQCIVIPRKYNIKKLKEMIASKPISSFMKHLEIMDIEKEIQMISATKVRELLKCNEVDDIENYITAETFTFIKEKGLYTIEGDEQHG